MNMEHRATLPLTRAAVVERAVDQAIHRAIHQRIAAYRVSDRAARYARLIVVLDRETRWWGVLLRHTSPYTPYYTAVLAAQSSARECAQEYRTYLATTPTTDGAA